MKLKLGDNVIIISGKEKGKKGKIMRVHPADALLVVEGVNLKKKHRRPTKSGEKGQVIEKHSPLSASKVKFLCPKCGKAARLGFKLEGGEKMRICKQCHVQV